MAKEIISLGMQNDGLRMTVRVAFWFVITSGAQPNLNISSAWSGASASDNTAIQAGTILEVVDSFSFPNGTPVANIKAYLQQEWSNRNAQIGGVGPNNTLGVFFDSVTGWSA